MNTLRRLLTKMRSRPTTPETYGDTRFYSAGSITGWRGFSHEPSKPSTCEGCRNYHGATYGRNSLVCAIHPAGTEELICGDWEAEEYA